MFINIFLKTNYIILTVIVLIPNLQWCSQDFYKGGGGQKNIKYIIFK